MEVPLEHSIRAAQDGEMEAVSKILASAFSHDPVFTWLSGYPEVYADMFRLEAESLYKRHGRIYINGDQSGAAMWLPPGISSQPRFHWRLLPLAVKLLNRRMLRTATRADLLGKMMAEWHLAEPHFYLRSIGARLDAQGRGIGSALLKAGLAEVDAQGMQAYLESSNAKNNPLYQRFGFEIIGEDTLFGGGPTIWFMRRAARGKGTL